MKAAGLRWRNWWVFRDDEKGLRIVNKESGQFRTLNREGKEISGSRRSPHLPERDEWDDLEETFCLAGCWEPLEPQRLSDLPSVQRKKKPLRVCRPSQRHFKKNQK